MKCPKCGYCSDDNHEKDIGAKFRELAYNRLEEYGFPQGMTPKKNQAYIALRQLIGIRGQVHFRAGGSMTELDYKIAVYWLNLILPPEEGADK